MKITGHSIKSSLSRIVLLIFGISCLIIAVLCTSSATSSIVAGKNANYEAAAAMQAQQMEEWFSVQTKTLDELALSVHSLGYDTDKFGDSVPYLADMTAMDSNIYAIYMGREDKSCVFSDGWDAAAENYDPTTRDWYTDAVGSDKTVISAPYVDAESGKMVITVSEAIRDGGKTTAVIAADIFVTSVIEIAESSIDSESYPILIDSQNNIIVHNNPEFIPSVDAQGNENVTSADSILEKGTVPDSTLFTADAYNGVKTVFAKTPVGDTGWQYLLAADSSVYYKEVNTMTVFFIVIFVIFLISDTLVLAGAVSRRLRPLGELNAAAEAMNAGDLGYVSKYRKDDEIGSACVAIEEANRKIHGYITDIGDNLSSMANGRFDRRIDMEYIGDFAQLRTSLIGIQNSLRATLQRINSVSQQVSQGSEQAANNAQELSRGAISQTEAVDRLTHTADSFGERLKGTFESTSTADRIANGMNIKVDECSSSMKRLGEAMNNINSTTEQIRIITKTVEDIAFQTNILALNAAVEAARAGSAGKGFAVVADEVRNLASKSAEAAGTTTQLIEKSCIAVENGVKLTQETKSKLEDIVTDTKKMQEHIRSISANAANEKQELDTITEEITNISLVVQSNTAAAEESAASSEELSGQATELNGMLREFSL